MKQTGSVKWFDQSKGYGFIDGAGAGDHFVHISHIAGNIPLRDGDKVSFKSATNRKGKMAVEVSLVIEPAQTNQPEEQKDIRPLLLWCACAIAVVVVTNLLFVG